MWETAVSALTTTQAVASTALTVGTAATAFTPVTASGGTTPYSFAVNPSLPAGLSFNETSGQITGTPTAASAATNYTVTVTGGGTSSKTFSLAVDKTAQTISFPSIADTNYGHIYTASPYDNQHLFALSATSGVSLGLGVVASSGLQVSYAFSGPCAESYQFTGGSYGAVQKVVFTGPGSCSITASQDGNANYAAAAPVTRTFNIAKGDQTISPDTYAARTFSTGGTFNIRSVAITGGAGNYRDFANSGSGLMVSYTSATPSVCSVGSSTLNAVWNGRFTYYFSDATVTMLAPGTCTLTASQAGDANFNAAANVSIPIVINAPALTTTQAVASSTQTVGTAATAFTPVTGSGGYGTLTYAVSPPLPAGLAFNTANGQITGTPTAVATNATYTVTVTDQTAPAQTSSKTFSLAVNKAAQTITFTKPADTPFVADGTVALSASASSNLTVAFASSTTGVCTISGTNAVMKTTGTCSITASQAGDATYAAATSVAQSFAITAPTLTTTAAVPSTTLAVAATATAFSPVTASGGTAPLAFAISPALPAGLSFNTGNGQITGTPTAAATAATYTVTVSDSTVPVQSSAKTFSLTVDKGAQTIGFKQPADATYTPSGTITLAAMATSSLTVVFASTTSGVCTVSGTSATIVTAGTCSITASQAGNANYNAATDVPRSFGIGKAAQTISFTKPADIAFTPGSTVSLTATATSGLSVAFASTTSGVCTVAGTTATIISAGTCSITASQAGNANYNAASDVMQSFGIGKAAQIISFTKPADITFSTGATVSLAATATSGLTVAFASTTASVCTVTGTTATILTGGNCSITASQAGNANYNAAADVVQSFGIGKATQTISFAKPADTAFTPGATVALIASATSGLTVALASTTSGVCIVSGTTATIVAAGSCSITASQAGNGNYNAANDAVQSFAIGKGSQTISFTKPADITFAAGATVALVATASSSLKVSFATTTSGVCSVAGTTATILTGGTCSITSSQPGNDNYAAATDVVQTFNAGKAGQTISFTQPGGLVFKAGAVVTLQAKSSSGLTVSFASTTSSVCTVSGTMVTIVAVGTCSVRASQTGNASYAAAPDVTLSFGSAAPPSMSATATVSPSTFSRAGETLVFSITISNAGGVVATGIKVVEPRLPGITCAATTVPAGGQIKCEGSTQTTAADLASGQISISPQMTFSYAEALP